GRRPEGPRSGARPGGAVDPRAVRSRVPPRAVRGRVPEAADEGHRAESLRARAAARRGRGPAGDHGPGGHPPGEPGTKAAGDGGGPPRASASRGRREAAVAPAARVIASTAGWRGARPPAFSGPERRPLRLSRVTRGERAWSGSSP